MKISVIIPAYNVEQYVAEALNSVLDSEYNDFEIILINDGSTDRTDQICRLYSEKYQNIVYLTQNNQGVSRARNCALKYANGEYVIFVDADDKISTDFLQFIATYAENNDILFFGCFGEDSKVERETRKIKETDMFLKEIIINNTIIGEKLGKGFEHIQLAGPWAKAYRREFLMKNNICFPQNIKIGEDLLFNVQCYINMKKGMLCKELVYDVTVRPESASHRYYENFIQIDRAFQIELLKILKKNGLYEKYKEAVYKSSINGFWQIIMNRIYISCNKENNKQKYLLLKNVRKDEIYDKSFKNSSLKKIYQNSKFSKKQKYVLYLLKMNMVLFSHILIVLWKKNRM